MIHTLVLSSDFPAFTAVKTTQTLIWEWDLQTYCHLCSSEQSFFHHDVQIQPRPALMWLHQIVKEDLSGLVLSVCDMHWGSSVMSKPSFLTDHCLDKDETAVLCLCRVTTEQCVWKYKYDMPYFIYFLFFLPFPDNFWKVLSSDVQQGNSSIERCFRWIPITCRSVYLNRCRL